MLIATKGKQLWLYRPCAYCGGRATTRDHVPPKLLLDRPFPPNLWTVPSCRHCNESFSADETYFRDALAHVSLDPVVFETTRGDGIVARSLCRQLGHRRRIEAAHVTGRDGRVSFIPDRVRFGRGAEKIAGGLYYIEHGCPPPVSRFQCLAVEHASQLPGWLLAIIERSFRGGRWPEVGSRALERAVCVPGDLEPQRHETGWHVVQPNVFVFKFARVPNKEWLCIMKHYNTVWTCVAVPNPKLRVSPDGGRPANQRLERTAEACARSAAQR
jgi:hypothetical protein